MNLIDLFLFLIIVLSMVSGYRKGFILGTIDLLMLALGLVFAFWAAGHLAEVFERVFGFSGVWNLPIAFILCYILARSILWFGFSRLLRITSASTHNNSLNKAFGIVPGGINGIIYAAIISSLLLAFPVADGISAGVRDSFVARTLAPGVQLAEGKLAAIFEDALDQSINHLTVEPGTSKSIELGFEVLDAKRRTDLEAEMLDLINQERQKEKLSPLEADPEMQEVALAHSADMFAKGYFSHVNKEGESPAQRAREMDVRFLVAGENLALAPTLDMAHQGLMNSPGHRANILHKSYSRVGIGILDGGRYGLMITQNFRN